MKIFIVSIGLFIAFTSTAQTANPPVEWLTHKDSVYNLTVLYPSDWKLKPPSTNARFFITSYLDSDADNFSENVNCTVPLALPKTTTIQMAEKDITTTLSANLPDFEIIRSGYTTWNGVSSYEIEYTCTQTSGNKTYYLHMLQKVAIIKGKLYALTFTSEDGSYNKYITTVRKIFQSFKVL